MLYCYCRIYTGPTDVRLSFNECPINWEDMATSEREGSGADLKQDAIESNMDEKQDEKTHDDGTKPEGHMQQTCLKTVFVILGIIGGIAAVALIVLAILTSIATKAYDAEQSSRMVAMVFMAVLAAFTICTIIYGEVAVFKKQARSINVAAVVLLLLAIVQALIAGISVNVEPADEAKLLKSLTDSFKQSREENPRHVKMWAMTQSDLNCCGVYGPEDYRSSRLPYYFPPNVPISCCPTYDSSRSDLVQERDRELCKVKKSYYTEGCKDLVLMVFKETSSMVFSVSVLLIVVEVLLIIIGAVLCRRNTKQ
ncbi:23 kDa integral membrane protein-like [Spodoptera frugiperda]|uniref:23 kDa integral membrane protein-like n=1 Tax=Spodoptera frugiperda TaxID=7108 RepID=A0A9R0E6I8_SPOFR|nr:23 kDa integral membrane protein-like [Spodoptera frugiperda]